MALIETDDLNISVFCSECDDNLEIEVFWNDINTTDPTLDIAVHPCTCNEEAASESGYDSGFEYGRETGYDDGYGEGFFEGKQEGIDEANCVGKLIEREFGNGNL